MLGGCRPQHLARVYQAQTSPTEYRCFRGHPASLSVPGGQASLGHVGTENGSCLFTPYNPNQGATVPSLGGLGQPPAELVLPGAAWGRPAAESSCLSVCVCLRWKIRPSGDAVDTGHSWAPEGPARAPSGRRGGGKVPASPRAPPRPAETEDTPGTCAHTRTPAVLTPHAYTSVT